MGRLGTALRMLLIVLIAVGSAPWCLAAAPSAPAASHDAQQLTALTADIDLPVYVTSRDTSGDIVTWAVRRAPAQGLLAGMGPAPSASAESAARACEPSHSAVPSTATCSLVSLHSQLTI